MKTHLITGACLLAACNLFALVDMNYNGLSDVYRVHLLQRPHRPFCRPGRRRREQLRRDVLGTDPTNAASAVTGPDVILDSGTVQLSWPAASYRDYTLEASTDLVTWQAVTNGSVSSFSVPLGPSSQQFYRLSVTFSSIATKSGGDGLDPWEEALYVATFGVLPSERDSDGDGLNDLQEFLQGQNPGQKDHPAVGLVVFTPLEK